MEKSDSIYEEIEMTADEIMNPIVIDDAFADPLFDTGELKQIEYIEAEAGAAAAREWGDAILVNRQHEQS